MFAFVKVVEAEAVGFQQGANLVEARVHGARGFERDLGEDGANRPAVEEAGSPAQHGRVVAFGIGLEHVDSVDVKPGGRLVERGDLNFFMGAGAERGDRHEPAELGVEAVVEPEPAGLIAERELRDVQVGMGQGGSGELGKRRGGGLEGVEGGGRGKGGRQPCRSLADIGANIEDHRGAVSAEQTLQIEDPIAAWSRRLNPADFVAEGTGSALKDFFEHGRTVGQGVAVGAAAPVRWERTRGRADGSVKSTEQAE